MRALALTAVLSGWLVGGCSADEPQPDPTGRSSCTDVDDNHVFCESGLD